MRAAPWLAAAAVTAMPATAAPQTSASLSAGQVRLEFDARLRTRVVAILGPDEVVLGPFTASESVSTGATEIEDFAFEGRSEERIEDQLGPGRRLTVTGRSKDPAMVKVVSVSVYEAFPRLAVVQVRYTNAGTRTLSLDRWTANRHVLVAGAASRRPRFWSYHGASYESRPDWLLPLRRGFAQENDQGMNASDYGGGTPVVDVWRPDVGLAVGHLETTPRLVSLPVTMPTASEATVAVRARGQWTLVPGQGFETLRTFVAVHRGDHFGPLTDYRGLMEKQGLVTAKAPASAFEPIWCAWGYGREFTVDQVIGTLPVAKRLGFRWATLDDGWQVAEGDWTPAPKKFPRGDADMRALVDRIHEAGFKAQLWWAPLAADPGSATHRAHPDWLLLGPDAAPRKVTWWDSFYLCPAHAPVRADAAAFVRKALGTWGYDGLKIDGQHLNGAPPCSNVAHAHASPEDAVAGMPGFFQAIWDAARVEKPGAVVEICPCGTAYSFFMLPYLNMTVASDPGSSWQIRLKGKTLKALHGDGVAYFGDHVEMSERGEDFASTVGVGGVIGTNFAWPGAPGKKDPKLLLTPRRERRWKRWTEIYQAKRLPEGEYLGNLYDIGFDRPETHAVRKGDTLYYAFYAKRFQGTVRLRGLGERRYRVRDYVGGRDLGSVSGPQASLPVTFEGYLLVEAAPE
jgi:alpha-galactosidase